MTLVAVYGTLRKGCHANGMLPEGSFIQNDTLKGLLIHLGGFPGLLLGGSGRVVAEVYKVDSETLKRLDGYEGYDERNPADSLYTRETTTTESGLEVLTYQINPDYAQEGPIITSGDWLKQE